MNRSLIPRRYAKALFRLAADQKCDRQTYDAMLRLTAACEAEPQLAKTLANPHVSPADKLGLIMTAAAPQGAASPLLADLVKLLEKNHRIDIVRDLALAYVDIYRTEHKIFSVEVTSAAPLEESELERITSLVKKRLPADSTAEISTRVNPGLIGGFTVAINNDLLDASVSNELKQLRLKLLSH